MNLFEWIKQEATVDDLAHLCYAEVYTTDKQGKEKCEYIGLARTPSSSLQEVLFTNKYILLQHSNLWDTIPKWKYNGKIQGEIKNFKEDIEKE